MARSAGRETFLRAAANPIALMKQADQPAANSCSGLVPPPAVPGDDSLTSRRPSELREAPSRPPVVWALAVYSTFSRVIMTGSFPGMTANLPFSLPALAASCSGRRDSRLTGYTGRGVASYNRIRESSPAVPGREKATKRKRSGNERCPTARGADYPIRHEHAHLSRSRRRL